MKFFKTLYPLYVIGFFYLLVNLFLRILLLFHPITQANLHPLSILKTISMGTISDVFVFTIASFPLVLYLLFVSDSKYNKPWGYLFFGLLMILLGYTAFFNTILNEYGGVLPEIGISYFALKAIVFGGMLFFPKYRKSIRFVLFFIAVFLFVLVIVQNAVSEFFFWNEFGVRYNFIAVDYLIYTNTVIGNIMESYPVFPLFIGIGTVTAIATYVIVRMSKVYLEQLPSFSDKLRYILVYFIFLGISFYCVPYLARFENSPNLFNNELQANGLYKFYNAFDNHELDFLKFYNTIPDARAHKLLNTEKSNGTEGSENINQDEIHKNVVLITVESLSADFMKLYGNKNKLTPFLDELASKSLLFSNVYATGNRTVRGLEAVTLCIPPTAGESIIKRKDNKNKFSTGAVFKSKGYQVKFLYGGDAYFDNMADFFEGNGYDVIDQKSFASNEITFSNIWGVCDEDMAKKALQVMDKEAKTGKPFFNHWMTVSNHRPFTYPEHKIDIPSDAKSREGGVKYTDYALRQFFTAAEKQPWFANTVFVIVADHCASSSGKTELPMEKYRIPAMVYAPGFIKPQKCTTLMSQIDVMPTVLGLLNFEYKSKFYGQDVLKPDYSPRAFIATYQDLGFINDDVLTILSPSRKVKQLKLIPKKTASSEFALHYVEKPIEKQRKDLLDKTVAFYQTTYQMLKSKKFDYSEK